MTITTSQAAGTGIPTRRRTTIGEWCTALEEFVQDRGRLPSTSSHDAFERDLGRAVNETLVPVARNHTALLEYAGLQAALPLLLEYAKPSSAPAPRARMPRRSPAKASPRTAVPAAKTPGAAHKHDARQLEDLRAYIAGHGHLPASNHPLTYWLKSRLRRGEETVPGMREELWAIHDQTPSYAEGNVLRWIVRDAEHIRLHGTLPQYPTARNRARRLELLRTMGAEGTLPKTVRQALTTVLEAVPISLREREQNRLDEVRSYVRRNGHLPPASGPLNRWIIRRIYEGDGPVPGVVQELQQIRRTCPTHAGGARIAWAQEAAAHHAEHGVFPPMPWREFVRQQQQLARLIERYELPEGLIPAIETVLGGPDPYRSKWQAVFADFTAWIDAYGSLPKRRTEDKEEYRLANWLNVQRANQRAGKLRPDLAVKLSAVPGALPAHRQDSA